MPIRKPLCSMKNTFYIVFVLIIAACSQERTAEPISIEDKIDQEISKINLDKLQYNFGGDTLKLNQQLSDYDGDKDTTILIGKWFNINSGDSAIYYLIFENRLGKIIYPELRIYNAKNELLNKMNLVDTTYILKSPKKRFSQSFRDGRWLFIETGIINKDSLTVLKEEKVDIFSILGAKYDSVFFPISSK